MNMALLHYRGGLMDGVSLEMEKWKKVLEEMGHKVDIVAGNNNKGVDLNIKKIGFEIPEFRLINKNAFEKLENFTEDELLNFIMEKSKEIVEIFNQKLINYDVIFPNNIWSLGAYLPVAIALYEFSKAHPDKIFISHHHDFWWEREYFLNATSKKIMNLLWEYCPPTGENIKHMVINTIAKEEVLKRKNIKAIVVPNVMDFDKPFEMSEKLNERIRKQFGISEGSVVFLQATRITRRKAIELAIDLINKVQLKIRDFIGKKLYNGKIFDGNIYLVFSGMCEDEKYKNELYEKAKNMNVKIIDMYKSVEKGIWSFWDLYNISDIITYPSILEGWGINYLKQL
ncbi:glycosyltransferase [Marinitoga lauensis]|uniref:glycosyltransferase n=1 Tax=Marinitoga lauensis TaxID=2201189 RepID=UPI001981A1D2|nr:glycosyltransferase [Marinitoga lauensis]